MLYCFCAFIAYICIVQAREAQFVQKFVSLTASAADGGLWEGMLFRYGEVDAHGDRFLSDAEVVVYGEPPVFVNHDYAHPPIGKIVQVSKRSDGVYVYVKLNTEKPSDLNYLSVGGYVYDATPSATGMDIKKIVVMEASLTQSPAQPNEPLKKLATMNTTEQKAEAPNTLQGLEEIKAQLFQEIKKAVIQEIITEYFQEAKKAHALPPTPAHRVAKQDLAAVEAMVLEHQTEISEIKARVAEHDTKLTAIEQAILALQQTISMAQATVMETAKRLFGEAEARFARGYEEIVKFAKTLISKGV